MRQLTPLDAQFLHAETATTAAHVAGVAVLDPACAPSGVVTREGLLRLLRERLHLAPALRMRLAAVPFGLDLPYWTEDPGFDLDHHVHESTLPAPGDEHTLAEHVARIHERHLDRRRPLWEMHLIHGLAGGRLAVYTKVHHCAIDGVSGAETLAALLDLSPEPRAIEPPSGDTPERAPDVISMLAGAATRTITHPVRALRSLGRTAADLDALPLASSLPGARLVAKAVRTLTGDRRTMPESLPLDAPRTPFNGPISGVRRFSYGSLPLSDVRRVGRTFGISVNDVVMALCASALRSWLRERDALPERPLIAAVPVAVRVRGAKEVVGNQISAMVAPMATHLECPLERLVSVGATMRAAKRRFVRSPGNWLNELSSLLPATVNRLATANIFRLAAVACPPINLIISNVPGPQFPLYLCGARVEAYYPISVLTDLSGGVNITCFSYDGSLDFGIIACPERVDDVWELFDHLSAAMVELVALADARAATAPASGAATARTRNGAALNGSHPNGASSNSASSNSASSNGTRDAAPENAHDKNHEKNHEKNHDKARKRAARQKVPA